MMVIQINKEILDKPRTEVMKKEFYFSNFSINLASLNNRLFNYDEIILMVMLIYNKNFNYSKVLFIMIESIKINDRKVYVNWINVVPLSKDSYK